MDEATVGTRLRVLRRWRGMTLEELAGLSGLSKSFLSMAERGQRALDRRSHIAALANALRVSETELVGGPHLTGDALQTGPHAHIPALRAALETGPLDDPPVDRARPLDELATLMAGPIERLRRRYDYLRIGETLPTVIDELNLYAINGDDADKQTALRTLVEAHSCAAGMARSLGYADLGQMAAMRADEAAVAVGDPVEVGKAAFTLIRPNAANWKRVKSRAERAADRLQPHVTDQSVPVLGMLVLNAALASAASLDRAAALAWLDEADDLARRVPEDVNASWQAFSPVNVAVWRTTVALELGDGGVAIAEQAAKVDEANLAQRRGRYASWLAEIGRGLARDSRTRGEAVTWLRRAEEAAPQRIRNDRKVREAIGVMLEQARSAAGGRELRGIAARMGVPH